MHRLEAYTEQAVFDAEKILMDAVIHALQVVCNTVAERIGQVTVAAATTSGPPQPTPEELAAQAQAMVDAAAAGPPGQPYVSVDDLASMPSLWTGQVQNLIMPLTGEIFRDSAGSLHAQMVDLVGPQIPSIGSQVAEQYLAGAANRWDFIGNDVWETARGELLDGFQQGESIPKLAARVRGSAKLSQRRATAVARTEVVSAANAGSYATAQSSELDMTKVWLATEDERTRPTHRAADGQSQPLPQPFLVGVSSLAFPGDPGGAPEETHNCRCTIIYEIPDAVVKQAKKSQPAKAQPEPEPQAPPVPAEPDLAEAANLRQADIDAARGVSDLTAEVDELINNGVDPAVLGRSLRAVADRAGIAPEVRDRLIANVDDPAELARIADELAADAGLTPIGKAGDIVSYDQQRHQALPGVRLRQGQTVEVVRRGHMYRRGDEDIRLSRAVVDEAPPGAEFTAVRVQAAPPPTLADLIDQTPTSTRQLGGGEIADTNLVTFADGQRAVEKVYGRRVGGSAREIKHQLDAEELGAQVLQAVGVRAPEVVRGQGNRILMEYLDGESGAEIVPWGQNVPGSILDSDDGRLMGLADILMGHGDRHSGNWIRLLDGHIGGIDHGEAFHHSAQYLPGSRVGGFGEYLTELQGFSQIVIKSGGIDLHPDDVAIIRARLEALRPAFEQRSRLTWFRAMMRLLKQVQAGADGTKRRLS